MQELSELVDRQLGTQAPEPRVQPHQRVLVVDSRSCRGLAEFLQAAGAFGRNLPGRNIEQFRLDTGNRGHADQRVIADEISQKARDIARSIDTML